MFKKAQGIYSEAAGTHAIAFKPTLRWHRGWSNPAEPTMSVSSKIQRCAVFVYQCAIALATRGRAPSPTPIPNPSLCWCFHVFGGPGPGKKMRKLIIDAFGSWFGAVVEPFFDDLLLRPGSKNIVKYSVFVLFAFWHYILQHGEKCVNTSIFADWPKNIVNTVVLSSRSTKNIGMYSVVCFERVKKCKKHHLFDDC